MLTVHEKYYEENLDHNLEKLLPQNLRIEKVEAFKRIGPIGDIGLRSFFQLYKKAKSLLQKEKFDFLYIPVPSYYCALLGRLLHTSTGIPYGIDYIDPWVHVFPGSEKIFSRHWLSTRLAKLLEPIAVKKASLITGVAEGYYKAVLDRNPHLKNKISGAMPYGGEAKDHAILSSLHIEPYLFQKEKDKLQMVYAGAMLPKAYDPLEKILQAISAEKELYADVEFHFIGTGSRANDAKSFNIKALAEKYGLWQTIIFEYPARIPYLDVLVHLSVADAVFILGSTEPHYTPSKVYQAILSEKPILAMLHAQSTAVDIITRSCAGIVLSFNGQQDNEKIKTSFAETFSSFRKFIFGFSSKNVDRSLFDDYSAHAVTGKLAGLLDNIIP